MITVREVDKIILKSIVKTETESVALDNCLGRVLAEDIFADRDFPPFNRVMMDGIAIRFADWQAGIRAFNVQELLPAGSPAITLKESGECVEVMTGAVCPTYADTLIKYEQINFDNGIATVNPNPKICANQHVHPQGSDRKKEELIIGKGKLITAPEIGVLATVGKENILVQKQLKVAIVATGDELVEVHQTPLTHQIRKSNVYTLAAALHAKGFKSNVFHIVDSKEKLRSSLKDILENHNVVVLSGGVSKGKLDFVPEILTELGVKKKLHFVKQRPGKPFWFGSYSTGSVFALPGNPNSSFAGLTRYVIPFLVRSEGVEPIAVKARLATDFTFKPDLTYFLQVRLSYDDEARLVATPHEGHGSADLANLVETDGFIELPMGQTEFKKSEVFDCFPYTF